MRKVDPADVIDDFTSQLDDLEKFCQRISNMLNGTSHERSDVSLLTEQAFVTAAVAFEGFFSDIVVGFVNRDSSALSADLTNRFTQSVSQKFGNWVTGCSSLSIPAHPKVQNIHAVLNPEGRNVTFPSAKDMKERVKSWLTSAHAAKFGALSVHEERVIDTVKAIRDFIAHRSSSSKEKMNSHLLAIGGTGTPNNLLGRDQRKVNDVGAFLKAVIRQPDTRRIQKYFDRIRSIAESFR